MTQRLTQTTQLQNRHVATRRRLNASACDEVDWAQCNHINPLIPV
jgi:hypothetical protein